MRSTAPRRRIRARAEPQPQPVGRSPCDDCCCWRPHCPPRLPRLLPEQPTEPPGGRWVRRRGNFLGPSAGGLRRRVGSRCCAAGDHAARDHRPSRRQELSRERTGRVPAHHRRFDLPGARRALDDAILRRGRGRPGAPQSHDLGAEGGGRGAGQPFASGRGRRPPDRDCAGWSGRGEGSRRGAALRRGEAGSASKARAARARRCAWR